MSGVIFLILRILFSLLLYGFLAWAILIIWQDLQSHGTQLARQKNPAIRLISQSDLPPRDVFFSQPLVTVGRSKTNDLIIDNDTVSLSHARLNYHHEQWWVEDLNSTNGTTLNEQEIDTTTVLRTGDLIGYGETRYLIRIEPNSG